MLMRSMGHDVLTGIYRLEGGGCAADFGGAFDALDRRGLAGKADRLAADRSSRFAGGSGRIAECP